MKEGKNFPPFHPNCKCIAVDSMGNQVFSKKQKEVEKETAIGTVNPHLKGLDTGIGKVLRDGKTAYTDRMNSQDATYLERGIDQILRGNYTENTTLLGTMGQVAAGII